MKWSVCGLQEESHMHVPHSSHGIARSSIAYQYSSSLNISGMMISRLLLNCYAPVKQQQQ
jgi:hypothetical protein